MPIAVETYNCPPDKAFLDAIEPFEKVILVRLRQTGGGYYDVYLETEQTSAPLRNTANVGHILKG